MRSAGKRVSNAGYSRGKWERADLDASWHLKVPQSINLVSGLLCITTLPHEAQFVQSLWLSKTIVWSTAVVPDLHNALQIIRFNQTLTASLVARGSHKVTIRDHLTLLQGYSATRLSGLLCHRLKSYVVSKGPSGRTLPDLLGEQKSRCQHCNTWRSKEHNIENEVNLGGKRFKQKGMTMEIIS